MAGENDCKNKKVEQNDPNGKVLKFCKPDLRCGDTHTISIWQPTVIIDSHMHIQSGRCAPLQYVQSLSELTTARSRGWIEGSGSVGGRILECLFEPIAAPARALVRALNDHPQNPQEGYFKASPIRALSEQARKTTKEIAADLINERMTLLENYLKKDAFYHGAPNLLFCSVVMTMDMEYSHIDGYFGIPVYNALYKTPEDIDSNEPIAYWTPQHGRWAKRYDKDGQLRSHGRGKDFYVRIDKKEKRSIPVTGEEYERYEQAAQKEGITGAYFDRAIAREVRVAAVPVLLPDDETKKYENWRKQLMYTEHAVLANPLKLLPMFHYDPRRWQLPGNDEPMSKVVADPKQPGQAIYLGFKMYTAQGYRPWDPRLPVLEDFYAQCCNGRIPIMNHCTPDGAATFEREEYRDFEHPNDSAEDAMQRRGRSELAYFNEHFVAPFAWKKVLDRTVRRVDNKTGVSKDVSLHSLRLCLAHFGGPTELGMEWNQQIVSMLESRAYPNLYTDISSSFADSGFREKFKIIMKRSPWIKDRILFGTDWFMTFLYSFTVGKNLWDYCVETKRFLDSFDTSLWPAFTQYNPYRFYRLDEEIERIAENIIAQRQTLEIEDSLGSIKDADINDILKEAAYIRVANQGRVNYEETP